MSSLDVLKDVLNGSIAEGEGDNSGSTDAGSDNTRADSTGGEADNIGISTLSQYLTTRIEPDDDDQPGILLELIRSEASNNDTKLPKELTGLTPEELFYLTGKFESHQNEIYNYKKKLQPIETLLNQFNQELNDLSSSLISLHAQSNNLSKNLTNKKSSTDKLNPIILDLMIPPDIANSIIQNQVDSNWIENLRFINEKTQLIQKVQQGTLEPKLIHLYKGSAAFEQLKQGIDILTGKALERVRDFVISQIKLLRSSTTKSSQVIQQDLLRVKEGFKFLKLHQPKLANQLQVAYLYTMKWYYQSRFAKYLYALEKLSLRHVDNTMVLGNTMGANDDKLNYFGGIGGIGGGMGGGLKNWIYSGNSNSSHGTNNANNMIPNQNKLTYSEYLASVDKRLDILQDSHHGTHKTSIPAQIAETTPFGYWIEFLFNQWYTALIDNVIVEYLFVVEFFYDGEEKYHHVQIPKSEPGESRESREDSFEEKDWSLLIFENVYNIGKEFLTWLVSHLPSLFLTGNRGSSFGSSRVTSGFTHSPQGTCDAYAILLMIRIIQSFQAELHNEFHIPVLEDHLNSLFLILWPQFTRIIDSNCDSMKKSVIRLPNNSSNLAPTIITQQFGQLLLGLLKLSIINIEGKDGFESLRGEPLYTSITRLTNDFENTLTKLSNQIKNSSEKEIFLYNNYFLIVNILKNENKDSCNDFISEKIHHFEMLCNAYKDSS